MNLAEFLKKKYDFSAIENKWKSFWDQEKIFEFNYEEEKPLYVVDTPPPYVSADHLHAGHIMSYAQAEFVVRYKRMNGYKVLYPMGFDDNGLPTERFVEKKYKINKSKITRKEFIDLCLKETEIGSQTYRNLWTNLGISVDWSKTYSTINPLATKISQWSLIDLHKKGALYRSKLPILWCPCCQTAIAQADQVDEEKDSKMNYIKFRSSQGKDLIIATTRPELLPGCVALYVNPDDEKYKDLINKTAIVPLFDYEVTIKSSEKVDKEFGTGIMMVCTWGDKEDMEKWRMDNLETRAVIKEDGTLNELAGKYQGLKIEKAREEIIKDLSEQGYLIKQEDIKHTVNLHERCDTPTELILSEQWFIKIADLKEAWLDYGRKINWYPKQMRKLYETWVNSLQWDWCISRQRYYGVPLPIWYCKKCQEPIFAEEKDLPVNPLEDKPPVDKCPKCGHTEFEPERDVMDTWATSSCTPFLVRELVEDESVRPKLFPVDLRPNAFEIIRTWDFYSIVKGHYNFDSIPFKDIMISGHGLDQKGKKISKRLGNYTPSDQLIEKYGADAIRYWATGASLGQNLRFNELEIKKGNKTAIKLWNVAKLFAMNLKENDEPQNEIEILEPVDYWILEELNTCISKVSEGFETYAYAKSKNEIEDFFWSKFTDYYLEFIKYRLMGENEESRKSAQFTFFKIFKTISKMYAPILPFVTEEIYQELFKEYENATSIHVSEWPKKIEYNKPESIVMSDFQDAINAIDEVRKYKSENKMPLSTVIEEYKLETKVDLEKYGEFIQKVIRVNKFI